MPSFADELKAEARKRPGDIVFRRAGGWSFGLSYGPVDPKRVAEVIERANLKLEYKGQDVTKSVKERFLTESVTEALELKDKEWMLSARLEPLGRSSTEADWKFLGTMVAALGAPTDSLITPFETSHPNSTHYWAWEDAISSPSP